MNFEPTLVIGVGNPLRSDDAIGVRIAEAIQNEHWEHVRVVTTRGENMDLLSVWKGYSRVVLIDAMGSKSPNGDNIVVFKAHEKPLPAEFERSSTHGMGPMESIELARVLGELPGYLLVVGVAGENFSLGNGLSADTAGLIPEAVKQIGLLLKGDAHA